MRVRCLLLWAMPALALAACRSLPTNFYLLTSVQASGNGGTGNPSTGPSIGVGPIEISNYLDRPQIVTTSPAGTVTLGEFDRWAEPLQDGFARVLGANLAALVPTNRITIFPWRRVVVIDYQVLVQLMAFEPSTDGSVLLAARWSVMGPGGTVNLLRRETRLREPAAELKSTTYADSVAAMSRTLAILSHEIADSIKALGQR